jgi:hypothetical protein
MCVSTTVSNIKNILSIFEAVQDTRDRMKSVFKQVKETGIIDKAKNTARPLEIKRILLIHMKI